MSDSVIKVSGLSKQYRIGIRDQNYDTLFGKVGAILRSPIDNFRRLRSLSRFTDNDQHVHWALKDINFEVKQGAVLGIIGHNGAGKSTLLKILSRITPPSTGEIEITGRVSSLLEVGTGFHPELTGRENVYMNGTIHGMKRREIDRKLEEIIDFSGVQKYIDTPVKFYSSGMKVRLGFAVAAHLEPDILIIDEVLAVGDVEFQKKCLGKMQDVAAHGRTVLFVSHDMGAVRNLCPETIILKGGKIFMTGETENAISKYLDDQSLKEDHAPSIKAKIEIQNITVQGETFNGRGVIRPGKEIKVTVAVNNTLNEFDTTFGMDIFNKMGTKLLHLRSDAQQSYRLKKGQNLITLVMDELPLVSGSYNVNWWIAEYKGRRIEEHNPLMIWDVLPGNLFNDQQSHAKNAILVVDARFNVQ